MLNSVPVSITVGCLLGFLAALGVGGGSLLLLWLTAVLNMPQQEARIINLLFFLPAAIIASLFRWKQGHLRLKVILPGVVCGCTAAALFAFWGKGIHAELLKKLLGGLLIFTGLRELFQKA